MIWVAFLGAAKGVSAKTHTRLTVLVNSLPFKLSNVIEIIANICCMALCVVTTWFGFGVAKTTWATISVGAGVRMGLVYVSMPICSIIMILFFVLNIIDIIKNFNVAPEKNRNIKEMEDEIA